jgi:hypothetical protein
MLLLIVRLLARVRLVVIVAIENDVVYWFFLLLLVEISAIADERRSWNPFPADIRLTILMSNFPLQQRSSLASVCLPKAGLQIKRNTVIAPSALSPKCLSSNCRSYDPRNVVCGVDSRDIRTGECRIRGGMIEFEDAKDAVTYYVDGKVLNVHTLFSSLPFLQWALSSKMFVGGSDTTAIPLHSNLQR